MSYNFPKTRYQGSKFKLLPWIEESIKDLEYNSVLDAFSGTSSVSYLFKRLNKEIYSNDIMPCNYYISKALIENNNITLEKEDIDFILNNKNLNYDNFIEKNFKDIYYTDDENKWLDIVVQNILSINNEYKKSLAFWALFQSCIIKRPYNLFHRKNLHIRMADVKRSFGNKTTWDKPFEVFFLQFVKEINHAIFNSNKINKVFCEDVLNLNIIKSPDLIYIDPPYIPQKGSITTYQDFYHFLNGVVDYYNWDKKIDYKSKNLKLKSEYSIWEDKKNILTGFENLFEKYNNSIIIVSYRNDGIPSINDLTSLLYKKEIEIKEINYKYVLSKSSNKEVLIIAK